MNGGFVAESAQAVPLVTGNGAIAITWTGAVARQHPGGRQGRPADEQAACGPPKLVSGTTENAARRRRGGRAERPGRDRVVAVRRPEPHLHVRRAVTRPGRPVRPPPDLLTPADATGISGPAVAFPADHRPAGRDRPDRPGRQRRLRVGGTGAVARPENGMRHDSRHGRDEGPDRGAVSSTSAPTTDLAAEVRARAADPRALQRQRVRRAGAARPAAARAARRRAGRACTSGRPSASSTGPA